MMTSTTTLPPTIPAVEPIEVLGTIIQTELGLSAGNIMLGLENWAIPKQTGLYIALLYGTETVIGNNNYSGLDSDGNFIEIKDCVMLHGVNIEVMSFDSSARARKEEVIQALDSTTAETLMEQYNMRLANTPSSFIAIHSPEPTKQLNRFQITVMMNALHRKTKIVNYFSNLQPVELVENP